jgi:hypothetical protein
VGGVEVVMPEDTTVQFFVIWALALTAIVNFITNLWSIFSGPSKRNAATLAEQATTLGRMEARLQSVELKQASLPTTEGMHHLELSMEKLRGELNTVGVQIKGQAEIMERLEAIVSRHDNHLMQGR